MRLHFHGAARTTTGSMHILEVNGTHILLDCGLYQGRRKEAFERNRNLPFDVDSIDTCVLSHAHIDHSGNLPSLIKRGYKGPIHATPPTRDLCEIMLKDSAYLQERDVAYTNKRRARQGKNLFEPLYTSEDVTETIARMKTAAYEKPTEIIPGVIMTYHDAGHILGSALTTFDITEDGRTRRLLFTGDMGRRNMPILRDPVVVHDVDALITESTYGNRLHPKHQDVKDSLVELCQKVTERGSKMIIPSFSVGRTQQILYLMHELWNEGRMCDIPVFVDSPLSTKATKIYDDHPECYDRDTLELMRSGENPFSLEHVRYTAEVQESKKLNAMSGPMIIISASGMCEGGRVVHHLKNNIEDERTVILFVGYQAEHTLGRRIVKRQRPIRIFGEEYELRAEVHSIQALSAHADKNEMIDYYKAMGPESVKHTFVVHGEPEQAEPFAEDLKGLGMGAVVVPSPDDVVDF